MNTDEFAFFNQQLAAMLRDGIPLEGGLRQLCAEMSAGTLRSELQNLEADLAKGIPLKDALTTRKLPAFYTRMVLLGARSNDLPGVLTLLADYYHRANTLWTRLKGLMVYPVLVVSVSLGLTLMLSLLVSHFLAEFLAQMAQGIRPGPGVLLAAVWLPPLVLTLLVLAGLASFSIRSWRGRLRWKLPAFREASLAQLASAMALMLKNGTTLSDSLAMAESLEADTPAAPVLRQWRSQLESGQGKPSQWVASAPFPPLFVWFVQNSGEDMAGGFQKAADMYRDRASYKIELALYGALPVSIIILGLMVLWQAAPLIRTLVYMMNSLGNS
ncbi:MAG TPA: type II secretion system F family protein [Candidatus Dormibacteraeota bacterium]|nr:type II secretion system F family protein [Candidatus Dormibacteraeota bacterium]